jgi:hypothetical protein
MPDHIQAKHKDTLRTLKELLIDTNIQFTPDACVS